MVGIKMKQGNCLPRFPSEEQVSIWLGLREQQKGWLSITRGHPKGKVFLYKLRM
jgi:hypothetical protein